MLQRKYQRESLTYLHFSKRCQWRPYPLTKIFRAILRVKFLVFTYPFSRSKSREWMRNKNSVEMSLVWYYGIKKSTWINRCYVYLKQYLHFLKHQWCSDLLGVYLDCSEVKLPRRDKYWPQEILPWNLLALKLVLMFLINSEDDQLFGLGIKGFTLAAGTNDSE